MHLEMLRASEHGGRIVDTLRQVGDYVEHEMEVRRLIARETLYPKIVLVVLVMLMGRSGIFLGMPAIAKLVVGVYSSQAYLLDTVGFAMAILIPILALVVIFRLFAFNSATFRNLYDEIKINLPVLGKIIRNFAIAKFARTYSALSKAGFPSSSALQIAGDASGNVVMARAGQFAALKAEQGNLPSQSLGQTKQFTHMTIDMLRTAELSGSVDEMMEKVADYHELEAKAATHVVCMIFSVGVLLIVGMIVGSVVIGQYTGYASSLKGAAGD
jgi:type II secretory pathway component PulF